MAITLRGVAINPADTGTLYDSVERSITPVASMATGDLCILICERRSTDDIAISNTGGQTWTAGALRQTGSNSYKLFWCRFNGTWSANPSIVTVANGVILISLYMEAWIPTSGSNTWALDITEDYKAVAAPVSPNFDMTANTGRSTLTNGALVRADFCSLDKNTWAIQTGGWVNPGTAQYRNADPGASKNQSISTAYEIKGTAGAIGNIVNRQLTLGGDAGMWIVNAWKEQGSGPAISSISDGLLHDTETGVHVLGAGFGASHTGSADVIICAANNVADASAVVQSISAWSATDITLNALALSSFTYFAQLYGFVKDSSGNVSAAFLIKREAWVSAAGVLKNLAGTAQTSLTNVRWRMTATSLNGTLVGSASNGTSDGSGNFSTGNIVLADTSILNPNSADPAWLSAGVDGGSLATSYAFIGKVAPTYS